MEINVSPTTGRESTHHLKLTDSGGTKLGLICVDGRGNRVARVAVNPYPSMASQLRQGRGKHADRVPPFEDIPLSDFSGGLAMLHHDEDASKYLDGKRIDTSRQGEVIHGGLETYTTGLRDFDENWPGNVSWQALYAGEATESVLTSFVAGATYKCSSIVVILKKVGSPTGEVRVSLFSSTDVELKALNISIGSDFGSDIVSERVEFVFSSVYDSIASGTTYQVRVLYPGGNSSNYIDVAVDGGGALYYRVLDDTGDFGFQMLEYKEALYGVTKPLDGSDSKLYILGDRGLADVNTDALTTLIDGTRTGGAVWTTDEWAGKVVKIIGGPGKLEEQNWRTIISNTTDTLTVSPAWTVVHTTSTEYVIIGSGWNELQTLTGNCKHATVAWNKIYFGFGFADGTNQDIYTRRYRAYNKSGVWTEEIDKENNDGLNGGSQLLLFVSDPNYKYSSPFCGSLWRYSGGTSTETLLYKYAIHKKFEDMVVPLWKLCKNDRAWTESIAEYTNATAEVTNSGSVLTVAAGFTVGKFAHWKFDSPVDLRGVEAITMYCNVSPAAGYTDGDEISLILADGDGNEDSYSFDGTTGEAYHQLFFIDVPTATAADQADITDMYLSVDKDEGAFTLLLYGPIYTCGDRNDPYDKYVMQFPQGFIVNNLINYAGGAGQPADKPWLIGNKGAYFIEGGQVKRIPLGELEELQHPRSGEGAVVSDVYLYFNMGETIQRYYAGHLDSVGPDTDYGLPANRRGIPTSMAAYPGKVLAAIDAGSSGYSSVIYRRGHGWHELYRGVYGKRIKNIHIVARADSVDRAYISEGADILWVPISINPQTDTGYEYVWESVLETSQIYGGLRETEKYYHALTIVSENLSTTNRYIQVDFRTSENNTYAPIGTNFVSSPRQRQDLVSSNDTTGRWIQFRLRSHTNDRTKTPKIVSVVLDALERLDVNDTYSYTVGLKEGKDKLLGDNGIDTQTGVEKLTQLETWVDDPKPLTLNTCSAFEDGKLVFIEGLKKRVRYHKVDNIEQELRLVDITLIEVS